MTTTAPPFTPPADIDLERGLLACVLHSPHPAARRLLAGMRADDFAAPMAQLVAQLVIELLARNVPPTPTAVLAHAETTGRVPALHDLTKPDRPRDGGAQRHTQLALWLIDTYSLPAWPGLGHDLKIAVLERAWRRAITDHAARLTQAAAHSPTDVLAAVYDDTGHIVDLQQRHHSAARSIERPDQTARPGAAPAAGKEAA